MPTYAELAAEPWWGAEFEPPALARFNARLRAHYGHTKAQTGSKGDNRHLRGRHRSINWALNSTFCTNRSYGTVDARDRRGNWNALRATDIAITGTDLRAASTRLDAAVRGGKLLGLAEWFGTKDGLSVVGWYEGHPSTSSSSHLSHLHLGVFTEHADDTELFDLLFDTITGGSDVQLSDKLSNGMTVNNALVTLVARAPWDLAARLDAILVKVSDPADAGNTLDESVAADLAAIRDALSGALPDAIEALPDAVANEIARRVAE